MPTGTDLRRAMAAAELVEVWVAPETLAVLRGGLSCGHIEFEEQPDGTFEIHVKITEGIARLVGLPVGEGVRG